MNLPAVNKIGYGLYILTTNYDGVDNGCIINSVCQVALNPDRIIVSVNASGYTCELIQKSRKFNLSILNEETPFEVFKHFGFVSGREKNKFENIDNVFRSQNGIFVVPKYANSFLSAEVTDIIDMGTHKLFVATVTQQEILDDTESSTYS